MLAVLFEVKPKPAGREPYLALAAQLRSALDAAPGFLFIDRFRSLRDPDLILSHQLWQDEAALAKWRNLAQHAEAQRAGRENLFADYRLRIAEVVESEHPGSGSPYVVIVASTSAACADATESFESIYTPGQFVSLFDAPTFASAQVRATDANAPGGMIDARRVCAVVRDYGMFERAQAPTDLKARHDRPAYGR